MGGLVKVEGSQIRNRIVPVLKDHEMIAGAYLFGSALEQCRPDSDIDIGLVVMSGFDISERELDLIEARIRGGLSPLGAHKFDLVFLTSRYLLIN